MAFLGIDHPLIAVKNLSKAIETYRSLGFFIAPPGQHPWGTSTALALFRHQILELVSIGDASLLDGYAAGGFRFGRHVEAFLDKSEGVALTALFTEDAKGAETRLTERGVSCVGTIDFGRDIVRADGQADRTKTTLKIFYNESMPRLSVFACQQHRRDLLEFPDRMVHPNGAYGFSAATIVTENIAPVVHWLTKIHGGPARKDAEGFESVETVNGHWRILQPSQFQLLYQTNLADDFLKDGPRIAALDVCVRNLDTVQNSQNKMLIRQMGQSLFVNDMRTLGGIAMRFHAPPIETFQS